jgi:hypothetical protein
MGASFLPRALANADSGERPERNSDRESFKPSEE